MLKLPENADVKLDEKKACASRLSKGHICNIWGTAKGIKLIVSEYTKRMLIKDTKSKDARSRDTVFIQAVKTVHL